MSNTQPVRVRLKKHLVTVYRAALTQYGDDIVSYTPPPEGHMPVLGVFFGGSSGDMSVPTMKAGRKARDDEFELTLCLTATVDGADSGEASDDVVWELFEVLESLHADDPTFGGQVEGLQYATFGRVDGPNPYPVEDAYASDILVTIDCKSRQT